MGKESEQTFSHKRHRWPEPWKHAQHHSSSGKCKLKPQWNFTSDLSEWALGKKIRKKYQQGCGEKGVHCWWECKFVQLL